MFRVLKTSFFSLAMLLLACVALVCAALMVAGTERGTAFVIQWLQNKLQAQVSWVEVNGTLNGPLTVRGLKLHQPAMQAEIDTLTLDWNKWALLNRRLEVTRITVDTARIELTPVEDTEPSTPLSPGSLLPPLDIALQKVTLHQITLQQPGTAKPLTADIELSATLSDDQLSITQAELHLLPEPTPSARVPSEARVSLHGNIRVKDRMPLAMRANWNLRLPAGQTSPSLPLSGGIDLHGVVNWLPHPEFELIWGANAGDLRPLSASLPQRLTAGGELRGYSKDHSLAVTEATLSLKETPLQISLRAKLDTRPSSAPVFNAKVEWQNAQWPLADSDNTLVAMEKGELSLAGSADDWKMALDTGVSGSALPGGNWTLQGAVEAAPGEDTLQLSRLMLRDGNNRLTASGRFSPQALALDWQLQIPSPADIIDDTRGQLHGTGSVHGTAALPELRAELEAMSPAFGAISASSLRVSLQAGLDKKAPLALSLQVDDIGDESGTLVSSLSLTAEGANDQHQLTLQANSDLANISAGLTGGLDESLGIWSGTLSAFTAVTAQLGQWRLQQPAPLAVSPTVSSLGETCLRASTTTATLCLEGTNNTPGDTTIAASVAGFPVQSVVADISGEVSGQLKASLLPDGSLRGEGLARLSPGTMQLTIADITRSKPYEGGDMRFSISEAGLVAATNIGVPEKGRIDATLVLPEMGALPLPAEQRLSGSIRAALPALDAFATFVPGVAELGGSLSADIRIDGTLAQPGPSGSIALRDLKASVPAAGLAMQRGQLTATGEPDSSGRFHITGEIQSKEGYLSLSGQASVLEQSASLQIQGNRFSAYDTPDARLWVSPDLQIAWRDNSLLIRGNVTVPEAEITPVLQLSPAATTADAAVSAGRAIAPSRDVVMINVHEPPPDAALPPQAPFQIDSQVGLLLGEDVTINAVGFSSQVRGEVVFTNSPRQADIMPMANGRLKLENGTFRSFGHDLEIENGQLIFANVPADQPEINLRAVRWIDTDPQVSAAGVTVTGPITEPVLALFSQPELEASEIQSYLLTGRSARSRETVLSLGNYITPRIYVGYGYSMVERTHEFNSLFSITPRYGISVNTGEADTNVNATFSYEH